MLAAALLALRNAGADYYIHCGDVGENSMLEQLAGLPAAFVWGNNDFDRAGMRRYAADIGVRCLGGYGVVELEGKKLGVMHGDDFALKREVLQDQQLDYLFLGHTHVPADERVGRTRIINPGALHRASQKTAALLDLATDGLQLTVVNSL